jgi:ribonuclease HI
MRANGPHYLLFSEASRSGARGARWRFVLQLVGSDEHLAAADTEAGASANRLELLAVVRGLEALEQPSRVTLLTSSHYVCRGVRSGLSQWRENGWQWECFGKSVPIRDRDLWKRMDRAMQIHHVDCCAWHAEHEADSATNPTESAATQRNTSPKTEPKLVAAVAAEPVAPPAPFEAEVATAEPALVIVPRPIRPRPRTESMTDHQANWSLAEALNQLRNCVLGPITAICRPAFTRAA